MKDFAIVGAGFTGAVLAHKLAENGYKVKVFEARNHVAGNCFSLRDAETDILIHKYGPHIFHTDNEYVWNFINQFSDFKPYVNRVKTTSQGKVFSLPINLHTINQFFDKTMSPVEAKSFIEQISEASITEPHSFEEQALKFVGRDLYEAFLKGYTLKQWGVDPKELPASILKRLPVRFNYDDNYFNHKFQGMPVEGYTPIVEKLLSHRNIEVRLGAQFSIESKNDFFHVLYTGPIDAWFEYSKGRLGYRTLDFVNEVHYGDYQGCAVMNYGDVDTPYTRISEHKHFAPWESHGSTIIFKEYSRLCGEKDIPYYPIRLVNEKEILRAYIDEAKVSKGISFLGRLGTYRYLDMDVTIAEALDAAAVIINNTREGITLPSFFVDPS